MTGHNLQLCNFGRQIGGKDIFLSSTFTFDLSLGTVYKYFSDGFNAMNSDKVLYENDDEHCGVNLSTSIYCT